MIAQYLVCHIQHLCSGCMGELNLSIAVTDSIMPGKRCLKPLIGLYPPAYINIAATDNITIRHSSGCNKQYRHKRLASLFKADADTFFSAFGLFDTMVRQQGNPQFLKLSCQCFLDGGVCIFLDGIVTVDQRDFCAGCCKKTCHLQPYSAITIDGYFLRQFTHHQYFVARDDIFCVIGYPLRYKRMRACTDDNMFRLYRFSIDLYLVRRNDNAFAFYQLNICTLLDDNFCHTLQQSLFFLQKRFHRQGKITL